jgi:hypothetical protein
MFSGIPTASLRVADLFASPYRLSVPSFQRLYSWSLKEAGQLLDDLCSAAGVTAIDPGEPDYFLSMIVLMAAPSRGAGGEPPHVFEIVDGQQRIVTLTLLLAVLRDLEDDRTDPCYWRFQDMLFCATPDHINPEHRAARLALRERDRDYLQSLIDPPQDACMLSIEPQSETERRLSDVRQLFIDQLSQLEAQERRQLAVYIADRVHMVAIFAQDLDRAHRMFTVLNERGKPLQRNDILKAEVLRNVDGATAHQVAAEWDAAAERLNKNFEPFFAHLRSLYGLQQVPIVAGIRRMIDDLGGPVPFLNGQVTPGSLAFDAIVRAHEPAVSLDREVRRHLIRLNWLSGADWVPSVLLTMMRHRDDVAVMRSLLAKIERHAFLSRLLGLGTSRRAVRSARVTDAVRSGKALDGDAPVFAFTREEVKTIGFNLRGLHNRKPPMCKSILLRLNEAMDPDAPPVDFASVTVEHVLPVRPSANSRWRKDFPAGELRDLCTESLGNLVLITSKQNDRAGNQDFDIKRPIYAGSDGTPQVLAITRDVIEQAGWKPDQVRVREARLVTLLAHVYELDLPTLLGGGVGDWPARR